MADANITLNDVVHTQSNELWDVVALLEAVGGMVDTDMNIDKNYISRMIRMACEKVQKVQQEFTPFI
jgi:hypothetical protein